MKVVILAGGLGTRLSEETNVLPKPMLPIGDKPMLHHIMDCYMKYGFNDFIIAAGYKREQILAYFLALGAPVLTKKSDNSACFSFKEFMVTVIDTGQDTQTGGRIKRLAPYLTDTFMLTYGDGLCNVDIREEFEWHNKDNFYKKHLVTMTAVPPVPRFGTLRIDPSTRTVFEFGEKVNEGMWINGGFFVVEPEVLDHIKDDQTNFEKDVLPILAKEHRLYAFTHVGYWRCCDSKRDLDLLNKEYQESGALWLTNKT
jgi:glucose-1-phosphate cytidylyltransferase